jgi:hypothetical protein
MQARKHTEKRMMPICLSVLAVIMLMLSPSGGMAHAPGKLSLDYDLQAQALTATITHTRFSDSHYIDKVEIRKNGNLISLQEYKQQPAETFSYIYKISAATGDVLEVKATCNKFGSKTEQIKISPPGKPGSR